MIDCKIREIRESDYDFIIGVLNEWWGGRNMSDMLPKLFFSHFQSTSLIAESEGHTLGFLVGFLSQTKENEAYIHFVGVSPKHRRLSIGKALYDRFFELAKQARRNVVGCVTSPVNRKSIAFHSSMGFEAIIGDTYVDGVPVHSNYDGPGEHRVMFKKVINV